MSVRRARHIHSASIPSMVHSDRRVTDAAIRSNGEVDHDAAVELWPDVEGFQVTANELALRAFDDVADLRLSCSVQPHRVRAGLDGRIIENSAARHGALAKSVLPLLVCVTA